MPQINITTKWNDIHKSKMKACPIVCHQLPYVTNEYEVDICKLKLLQLWGATFWKSMPCKRKTIEDLKSNM